MPLNRTPLPDHEVERLAKLPIQNINNAYAQADAWWEYNKDHLIETHRGKQLLLNADTLLYVICEQPVRAPGDTRGSDYFFMEKYKTVHGPLDPHGVRFYSRILVPEKNPPPR